MVSTIGSVVNTVHRSHSQRDDVNGPVHPWVPTSLAHGQQDDASVMSWKNAGRIPAHRQQADVLLPNPRQIRADTRPSTSVTAGFSMACPRHVEVVSSDGRGYNYNQEL